LVLAKRQWCSSVGKVTAADLAVTVTSYHRVYEQVTCGLTAKRPGSASSPTPVNWVWDYYAWKPRLYFTASAVRWFVHSWLHIDHRNSCRAKFKLHSCDLLWICCTTIVVFANSFSLGYIMAQYKFYFDWLIAKMKRGFRAGGTAKQISPTFCTYKCLACRIT